MKRIIIVAVAILAIVGLVALALRSPTSAPKPTPHYRKGTVTPDGKLVIYDWGVDGDSRYRALDGDYGMMVFYSQEDNTSRYELFLKRDAKIETFQKLEDFLAALSAIPNGSTIVFYNTCGPGTHSGMPKVPINAIQAACKNKEIKVHDEYSTICTCK